MVTKGKLIMYIVLVLLINRLIYINFFYKTHYVIMIAETNENIDGKG